MVSAAAWECSGLCALAQSLLSPCPCPSSLLPLLSLALPLSLHAARSPVEPLRLEVGHVGVVERRCLGAWMMMMMMVMMRGDCVYVCVFWREEEVKWAGRKVGALANLTLNRSPSLAGLLFPQAAASAAVQKRQSTASPKRQQQSTEDSPHSRRRTREPEQVAEPEALVRRVRVERRVAVLVVVAVRRHPLDRVALAGLRADPRDDVLEPLVGLEGLVRQQAVVAAVVSLCYGVVVCVLCVVRGWIFLSELVACVVLAAANPPPLAPGATRPLLPASPRRAPPPSLSHPSVMPTMPIAAYDK